MFFRGQDVITELKPISANPPRSLARYVNLKLSLRLLRVPKALMNVEKVLLESALGPIDE